MTKRRQPNGAKPDVNQLPLNFDVFVVETPAGAVAVKGENALDAGIRQALSAVLDTAFNKGLSRERVADAMTALVARPITKAHLDLWVAPSQADRRIPVDAFMALMTACQDYSPLEWMAGHFSRRVLTADEALCAEFGAMAVLDRHIRARQKTIEGQMDEKLFGHLMRKMNKASE